MERVNTITSPKSSPIGKCEDFSLKSSTSIKHFLRNKASSSPCRGVPSFTSWTTRGRRRFVRMVTSATSAVSPVWIPLLLTSSLFHHRFVILEKPTALKLCGGRNGNRKTPEHQSCETSGSCLLHQIPSHLPPESLPWDTASTPVLTGCPGAGGPPGCGCPLHLLPASSCPTAARNAAAWASPRGRASAGGDCCCRARNSFKVREREGGKKL